MTIRRIESNEPRRIGQMQLMPGMPMLDYFYIPGKTGRWVIGKEVFALFHYSNPRQALSNFLVSSSIEQDKIMSTKIQYASKRRILTFLHIDVVLKQILPRSRKEDGKQWQKGEREALDEFIDTGAVAIGETHIQRAIAHSIKADQELAQAVQQLESRVGQLETEFCPTLTKSQCAQIQKVVKGKHYRTGISFQRIYFELNQYFQVSSYYEIPREKFNNALQFIEDLR